MQKPFNSLLIPARPHPDSFSQLETPVGVNSKSSLTLVKWNPYLSTKTKEKQEETFHKIRTNRKKEGVVISRVNAEDSAWLAVFYFLTLMMITLRVTL